MPLRASALAAVLLLTACGSPTPAAPALEPTPNPTPVPAPTPSSARVACGVGPGTGDGLEEHCPRNSPSFLEDVDAAINRVVARHPELFDLDNKAGAGGYFVRDIDEFYRLVVQAEPEVFTDGEVREQREVLKHIADAALACGNVEPGGSVQHHARSDRDRSGVRPE